MKPHLRSSLVPQGRLLTSASVSPQVRHILQCLALCLRHEFPHEERSDDADDAI